MGKAVVIKLWVALEFNKQSGESVSIRAWADSVQSAIEKGNMLAKSKDSVLKSFSLHDGTEKIEDWLMSQNMDIFRARELIKLLKEEVFRKLDILNIS